MKYIFLPLFILLFSACSHKPADTQTTAARFAPFSGLVKIYEGPLDHLSAVRYGACPMHPTCSQYARQAMDKHGEVIGWMMACDRLMRCGRDVIHIKQKIWVNGQLKYYDPLDHNDCWWHQNKPVADSR